MSRERTDEHFSLPEGPDPSVMYKSPQERSYNLADIALNTAIYGLPTTFGGVGLYIAYEINPTATITFGAGVAVGGLVGILIGKKTKK